MLHLLLEYAEASGLAAAPGFRKDFVRWLLRMDGAGKYVGVMRRGEDKGKGDLFRLPRLSLPEMKAGGAGTRHFLCDTAEVVTLLGADDPPDTKLAAKHAFFVELLRHASESLPVLSLIADELSDDTALRKLRTELGERGAKPLDNVTFAVDGVEPSVLVEDDLWHDWYARFRRSLTKNTSGRTMVSLAGGELVTPAKTHGVISGLAAAGGIAMGDSLASFKQEAFRHFGLIQAENAAVSEGEAATYRTALESLIRERSRGLAGGRIVYWYAGPRAEALHRREEVDPVAEELLPMAPDGGEEGAEQPRELLPGRRDELRRQAEAQAAERMRKLLEAIDNGERPDLIQTRFYAMSVAANSGRIVVRDWMEGEFKDLVASVLRWMQDLRVTRLDSAAIPEGVPRLESLVTCMLPPRPQGQKYDDWVKPVGKLREPLWRAAVGMRPSQGVVPPRIPDGAPAMMLPRWRASILNGEFEEAVGGHRLHRSILYARVSLLKACLIRKGVTMEPCLFEDHEEPAYQCGRLLAVLADLQKTALGDVGANVVQRYYARASTAPADAIGPLVRLSNAHLDKIRDKGLADYLQGKIADIFGRLCLRELPATLDAVGQSLFAMGYYQQVAKMRQEMLANAAKRREREKSSEAGAVVSTQEGD